jgi:signal transduction histidine kinase/CheY-like chemotaxis protein
MRLRRLGSCLVVSGWALASAAWAHADGPGAAVSIVSLHGPWKFRAGDDPAWSRPDLDETGWADIEVPTGWGPVGYTGPPAPFVWYRRTVHVTSPDRSGLGLALGAVDSAYELYLGGRRVGGVGALPPQARIDYDRRAVYPVPPDAIEADGRLVVAVRLWSPLDASRAGSLHGGPVALGPAGAIERAEAQSELPLIVLATIFAVVGVSHVVLYWRGREHLWFGVIGLCAGLHTLLRTQLKYSVFDSFVAAKKLEHFLVYFFMAAMLEFLWPLLGERFRPWHRAFQALNVLVGVTMVLVPGLAFDLHLLPWCQAEFIVSTVYVAAVVWRAFRRGHPEARTAALGFLPLAAAGIHDSFLDWGLFTGPRLLPLGFALLVVAMGHALSRRFKRTHHELVALREELETRVASRTAALEERSRELAEANEAKTRFLANISHEIRTPLNGILGVNRMLLQSLAAGGRERELGEIVQMQGRSLLTIINDILDYSKIEAGRFVLEPTDFSLRRVINDAARVYREQAKAKDLEFILEVEDALAYRVHGDGVRLRQIVDNLLTNAVKFTEKGSVTLRVRREGQAVRFEVKDTGIGVDDATLAGLFQPFTQADSTTTRKYGGTGLGLAIAKSLVEMMGGTIGATGTLGAGATFWIVVPLGAAQQAAGPLTPTEPRTPIYGMAAARAAGHALVAEDNAINRMVTVALLREAGWTADIATNGVQAVTLFGRREYDLVLLDCRMPELDGYAAAQQMRQHEGGGRRTPIVALTAYAVAGEADRCRAAGMDDYLTKPISAAILGKLLDQYRPKPAAAGGAAPTIEPMASATSADPRAEETGPALDPEVLDDLGRRSPALLRQLLEQYVGAIPGEMAELRATATRGDRERLAASAHDLVGSALLVGARELARRLRLVEALDAKASPADVQQAMARVDDEHRRVLTALVTRVGAMSPPMP